MHKHNNSCCELEFFNIYSITLIAFSGQFTSHALQAMQSFGFFTTAFLPSFANTAIGHTSIHVKHPLHFLESILG